MFHYIQNVSLYTYKESHYVIEYLTERERERKKKREIFEKENVNNRKTIDRF